MAALPKLEIITFGAPAVRVNGSMAPPEVSWRKHVALLTYLALSPQRTRTRAQLMGLFWPETTDKRSRGSLNEAVRRLRAGLGADRLLTTGASDALTLSDEGLWIDAAEFDRLAAEDPGEAIQYLRGDFFEGFTLDDAPEFDTWLVGQREHYRRRGSELLVGAADAALSAGALLEAEEYARRALGLKRLTEPAVDILIRALALSGDTAGALAAFAEIRDALAEIREEPSARLTKLAERVRSQEWIDASPPFADVDAPLAGRATALGMVSDAIDAAVNRGPYALAPLGDPGMGRTRLIAECASRFALQGGVVVVARTLESDLDAPWSSLRALARAGLAHIPGVAGAAPDQLRILAAIAPEIPAAGEPVPPRDIPDAATALAELLRAVAEEQPLLIALDDAHYADDSTLEALHAALLQLQDLPILFVLSSLHVAHDASRASLALRGEIGRGVPGTAIHLGPLSDDDVAVLVDALATWCRDDEERARLTRRIAFETNGNPFLSVTLLRGLAYAVTLRDDIHSWPERDWTYDAPLPISVPDLARVAIVADIANLDPDVRYTLAVASVIDSRVDRDLLAFVAERDPDLLDHHLEILERRRLLSFDGTRYAFAAPLMAQVIRTESLVAGERRRLRARAIEVLTPRADLDSHVLRVQLLAETTPSRETAEAAGAVARRAREAGAIRTALRAVAAAKRAVRKGTDDDAAYVRALHDQIHHEH